LLPVAILRAADACIKTRLWTGRRPAAWESLQQQHYRDDIAGFREGTDGNRGMKGRDERIKERRKRRVGEGKPRDGILPLILQFYCCL